MNFTPTASQRKEVKAETNQHVQSVEWEKLVGKRIYFWSLTIDKVKDVDKTKGKFFLFHTTKQIGYYTVKNLIQKEHPLWIVNRWSPFTLGKNIKFTIPYMLGHAVVVKTDVPVTWLELMECVVRSLEREL